MMTKVELATQAHLNATGRNCDLFTGRWVDTKTATRLERYNDKVVSPDDSASALINKLPLVKTPERLGLRANKLYYITLVKNKEITSSSVGLMVNGNYFRLKNKALTTPLKGTEVKHITVEYKKIKGKFNLYDDTGMPLLIN